MTGRIVEQGGGAVKATLHGGLAVDPEWRLGPYLEITRRKPDDA